MDSLTQIVLGSAVGEVCLGKKIGNKALFYGAIAGTIPDLDIVLNLFTDTLTSMEWHRGISHSLFFCLLFSPVLGFVVHHIEQNREVSFKSWGYFFFFTLFTHPLLDLFTTWGTQILWPLPQKFAFHSIFVADPLYTIPFLVCIIWLGFYKKENDKRRRLAKIGLILSSGYLILGLGVKTFVNQVVQNSLKEQQIEYQDFSTRPSPLNIILWNINVMCDDRILISNYSLFDKSPHLSFYSIPKNHHLIAPYNNYEKIKRLKKLSENWYVIQEKDSTLFFNDLRFGQMGYGKEAPFVFSFRLDFDYENADLQITENNKSPKDGLKLVGKLFDRIKGI